MASKTERGILNNVAEETDDGDFQEAVPGSDADEPVYKMLGDNKIPVSKYSGPLWKSRRDSAEHYLVQLGYYDAWDECISYYRSTQGETRVNRDETENRKRNRRRAYGQKNVDERENIVFSNTTTLVPSLYAKNPSCEITVNIPDDSDQSTPQDDENRKLAITLERLLNVLVSRKEAPGVNLKPKARKQIVMATLTNLAYLETGYTFREAGSEQALADLEETTKKLQDATSPAEIEAAEGELMALEEKVDYLRPAGPWVRFRHCKDVLFDPDAEEADLCDAKWVMVKELIPTSYINAVYRKQTGDKDDRQYADIYSPTHVLPVGGDINAIQDQINNFSLIHDKTDHRSYGYKDDLSYRKAQRTQCWWVWDKVTRRVYLFNDKCWTWPIWVWDDPYQLEGFFTITPLQFYADPEDPIGPAEVMMYLDQQDTINNMNGEMAKIRDMIQNLLFYNQNLIEKSTIDAYLEGGKSRGAMPIDLPTDADIQKAIFTLTPPSANFLQMFDKQPQLQAIQRVSSVSGVMQGEQFKTNTTNQAIETYNSQSQTRLDEKIDAVEDCLSDVFWKIGQLCLQFMPPEQVAELIGETLAQNWRNVPAQEIPRVFSARIVGGSSQKPTSQIKKQQALQMGQVLGQFGQAGGGSVVLLILKMMQRAFDDLVISDSDWEFLQNAIVQGLQQGQTNGTGQPEQPGAEQQQQQGGPEALAQQAMQIAGMVDQLPDQLKVALGTMLARGVPAQQAVQAIIQRVAESQQTQQ